jgi:hypothetical protein
MSLQLAERRCESCRAPLPTTARRDRRYCNGRCRAAASARRRREAQAAAGTGIGAGVLPPELQAALDHALEEHRLVARVAAAAPTNWRAAAWLLSRRFPDRWGDHRAVSGREVLPGLIADDPFREVDELAVRRREAHGPQPRTSS